MAPLARSSCLLAVLSLAFTLCSSVPLTMKNGNSLELLKARLGANGSPAASLTCSACKVVVNVLQDLFARDASEEEIEKIIIRVCIDLKIEDENVCTLIVPTFQEEVLTVFDQIALSDREICGYLLGPTCEDAYDPYHQNWNISIPGNKPPVVPIPDPKPGSPVNGVLHISDLHWDSMYTPGLSNDCGEPLCCRPPNKPGTGSTAAGYWGDYMCDVPYHTLENMMQSIVARKDEFEWVYMTGDLPAHNVWNQSRDDQLYVLKTLVGLLKKYLPDKIIFPTLGNHESAPVNSFPPPFVTGEKSNQWLLDAAADQWSDWLKDEEATNTIKRGGFYNVKVRDGLRVISLQTNFANSINWWLLINDTDPAGQLQWLVQQLLEAEKNEEKVHIIGHIPPSGFTKSFGLNYHRIVNRFESTISGQFFGHTHDDRFEVFFDEQNSTRATNVAILGPAVTPRKRMNMGYRVYTVDGPYNATTSAVLDHKVYYMNISDANLSNKPNWQLEYSAKADLGMTRLHPADWKDLVDRFRTDDALFQKFYKYIHKMHTSGPCDGSCKSGVLCSLLTTRPDDPDACKNVLVEGVTMEDVYEQWAKQQVC
ncbi:sphingomyelin phosphodiesterase-like isoform X2 [Halichondria panicea]|uniref:sphingomyelin phosphodiesterase-like isoform X2 n=1 Tax=Halichondria panicea TaxID=6063 RepID=UPI00312B4296